MKCLLMGLCCFITYATFSMQPTLLTSYLGISEAGDFCYEGVLSNGNKVIIEMHRRTMRSGVNIYYSGKINKKKLTVLQAAKWAKKLEQGADYRVLIDEVSTDGETPYFYSRERNQ